MYVVNSETHIGKHSCGIVCFKTTACCSAFQLGSIDRLGPAVKRLSDRYHPRLPLAVESADATVTRAGIHSSELAGVLIDVNDTRYMYTQPL